MGIDSVSLKIRTKKEKKINVRILREKNFFMFRRNIFMSAVRKKNGLINKENYFDSVSL